MYLYYYPGACSLASHIILREIGQPFELIRVDLGQHRTERGEEFLLINPKGYVPALKLDDGNVLTEVQVILQYLADQAPEAHLAPPPGSLSRYRLMEWLAFIATELHKGFGPFWNPDLPEACRVSAKARLLERFRFVDQTLSQQSFLSGDQFTLADAYLFTILGWCHLHKIDLGDFPNLMAYQLRMAERGAVKAALEAEGLC